MNNEVNKQSSEDAKAKSAKDMRHMIVHTFRHQHPDEKHVSAAAAKINKKIDSHFNGTDKGRSMKSMPEEKQTLSTIKEVTAGLLTRAAKKALDTSENIRQSANQKVKAMYNMTNKDTNTIVKGKEKEADRLSKEVNADRDMATKKANQAKFFARAAAKKMQKEEVKLEEAVTVKKSTHSWGKMITVHHGASHSFPLHPKHQEAIGKLKDGESTSFTDETNSKVTAHRDGDTVHLSLRGSNTKTPVPMHHFTEEVENVDEGIGKALAAGALALGMGAAGGAAISKAYPDKPLHYQVKKIGDKFNVYHKNNIGGKVHFSSDSESKAKDWMKQNEEVDLEEGSARAENSKKRFSQYTHMEFARRYPPGKYSDEALRQKALAHGLPRNHYVEKRRSGMNQMSSSMRREEVELDEGMPSGVIKDKQRLSQMTDQEFAQKYKDSTEASLRAKARVHAIKDPDHYIKRREAGLKEELELDEAKKGRPRKDKSKPAHDDDDEVGGRVHIIVQLRKAENLRGNREIEFNDGEKHQLPLSHVKKALDMHVKMKPIQKGEFEARLAKSHSSFHDAVSGKPAERSAKPRVTLAKSVAEASYDPTTNPVGRGALEVRTHRGPDGVLRVIKTKTGRRSLRDVIEGYTFKSPAEQEEAEEKKEKHESPKGASVDMTADSKSRIEKDPLASKEKIKLPPTVGNQSAGGEDTAYAGGKYSVAEEKTLNSLYEDLSEENRDLFNNLMQTEEGIEKLLQFARGQGY